MMGGQYVTNVTNVGNVSNMANMANMANVPAMVGTSQLKSPESHQLIVGRFPKFKGYVTCFQNRQFDQQKSWQVGGQFADSPPKGSGEFW